MTKFCPFCAKLIIESIVERKPLKINHIPPDLIYFAKVNKVLFLLGHYDDRIRKTSEWIVIDKRCREQLKTIIEVVELAEKLGIEILIVKTLKPFRYAPDDIDILVIEENNLCMLLDSLRKRGYILHKKGTPEVTLRKIVNGIIIDLDVHTKMGAGSYEYIDKHYLWKRRIYKNVSDRKITTPNEVDELLITAAHAVMKELMIRLADVAHVLFLDKSIIEKARQQSMIIGLSRALKALITISYSSIRYSSCYNHLNKLLYSSFPVKVSLQTIISSYQENFMYRLRTHGLKPVSELIKMPTLKGTSTLLKYIGL